MTDPTGVSRTPLGGGRERGVHDIAQVRGAYAGTGVRTRLHVTARAATCPLDEIEALVPECATVLDVGCGHGLLSLLLALRGPHRTVFGVDVDGDKLRAARSAARRVGLADRVRFEQVDHDWTPGPHSVDAILLVDVVYLLGHGQRDEMLGAAVRAVGDGIVVVKEMADRPRWKRAVTVVQEVVSVHVAGITHGDVVALPREEDLVTPLVRAGAAVRKIGLGRRRLHPHLAVVAQARGGESESGRR